MPVQKECNIALKGNRHRIPYIIKEGTRIEYLPKASFLQFVGRGHSNPYAEWRQGYYKCVILSDSWVKGASFICTTQILDIISISEAQYRERNR